MDVCVCVCLRVHVCLMSVCVYVCLVSTRGGYVSLCVSVCASLGGECHIPPQGAEFHSPEKALVTACHHRVTSQSELELRRHATLAQPHMTTPYLRTFRSLIRLITLTARHVK